MSYADVDNIAALVKQEDGYYLLLTTLVDGKPYPIEWGKLSTVNIKGDERLALGAECSLFAGNLSNTNEPEEFCGQIAGATRYTWADLIVNITDSSHSPQQPDDVMALIRSYGFRMRPVNLKLVLSAVGQRASDYLLARGYDLTRPALQNESAIAAMFCVLIWFERNMARPLVAGA